MRFVQTHIDLSRCCDRRGTSNYPHVENQETYFIHSLLDVVIKISRSRSKLANKVIVLNLADTLLRTKPNCDWHCASDFKTGRLRVLRLRTNQLEAVY
ncbi:hypothetical protein Mp_5g05320 [Marchantia polymorpha subsp. ruderalis]|uniref:Uncharacterized protein n=2 Tax=Marchantia polymorpha TaxID=3197 RepID=A0AAF6BF67_MARPO|nr:hypothetical protein MARPO_0027s0095 [Marchantia polymorpha]BBN10651.1 hypothetical protein Mp_5g05320 [Marchantia polymorpha subsp. ruderalis]|eukprot:PTQ42984.1 hypothetical protein MARPO_0027s0095 [Marchantia polymorpha]